MRFRKIMTSQGWIKSDKYVDFDLTPQQIDEGRKRDHTNPLFIQNNGDVIALYSEKNELRLKFYTSYYGFAEGFGEHGLSKSYSNAVVCICGEHFYNKVRKSAVDYLNEHLQKIEDMRKEFREHVFKEV